MSDSQHYLSEMSLVFKDETPAASMVAISMSLATYHNCTVKTMWHNKSTTVDENTDMLRLLRELEEWDS